MDDFDAFRKKKQAEREARKQGSKDEAKAAAAAKKMGWVEGLGPAGPTNPKIKGFVLGRFRKKRLDPRTLQRPEGYESHTQKSGPSGPDPGRRLEALIDHLREVHHAYDVNPYDEDVPKEITRTQRILEKIKQHIEADKKALAARNGQQEARDRPQGMQRF
ncbi:hypothetical protein OAX78_03500 [Planctomycetota bacterium]|nr:hypothetical protein [Planctomycetota bacterium]